jgi:hypothetical protein
MTNDQIIDAIRAHDWDVTSQGRGAPPSFGALIQAQLSGYDAESRELAAECVADWNGAGAGSLLLSMTADIEPQVAAAAAHGLGRVTQLPPIPTIVAEIPRRQEPFVRGQLYKIVGATRNSQYLETLRAVVAGENSPDAQRDARRSLVQLGGQNERAEFRIRVAQAKPDEAMDLHEDLVAIADPRLAKATLPWLSNGASVMRIGSDRSPAMARMCDVAVWTAFLLKIPAAITPAHLAIYSPKVIADVAAALSALPD